MYVPKGGFLLFLSLYYVTSLLSCVAMTRNTRTCMGRVEKRKIKTNMTIYMLQQFFHVHIFIIHIYHHCHFLITIGYLLA